VASIPFNLDEVDLLLDLVYDFREDIEDGSIESPELQSLTVSTYDLISKLNSVKSSIFNGNDFEFLDMLIEMRKGEIMDIPMKKRTAEVHDMLKALLSLGKKLKLTMDGHDNLSSFDKYPY